MHCKMLQIYVDDKNLIIICLVQYHISIAP